MVILSNTENTKQAYKINAEACFWGTDATKLHRRIFRSKWVKTAVKSIACSHTLHTTSQHSKLSKMTLCCKFLENVPIIKLWKRIKIWQVNHSGPVSGS